MLPDLALILAADLHELPAHHDGHVEAVGVAVEIGRGVSEAQVQVTVDAVVQSAQCFGFFDVYKMPYSMPS